MLGDDGVTRKQRRTDLADEDRQREVPRTDAREYATADELQFIALAGPPRQRQRREPRLCLFRVVTADVDRLARSEEHTSELPSPTRSSYAGLRLKQKTAARTPSEP